LSARSILIEVPQPNRLGLAPEPLQGGSELIRNDYLAVVVFRMRRILMTSRTARAFQTVQEVEQCTAEFARVVPPEARRGMRHLLDMRGGPVRVHPALDPAFARFRRETELGFVCSAIVISSPLGHVRATRLAATAQLPMALVGSVDDALEFFASGVAQP